MRTHIDLQEDLLNQVLTLGRFNTKKDAVNHALAEYSKILKRKEIIKLQGKIDWEGDLNQLRQNRENY